MKQPLDYVSNIFPSTFKYISCEESSMYQWYVHHSHRSAIKCFSVITISAGACLNYTHSVQLLVMALKSCDCPKYYPQVNQICYISIVKPICCSVRWHGFIHFASKKAIAAIKRKRDSTYRPLYSSLGVYAYLEFILPWTLRHIIVTCLRVNRCE